MTADVAIEIENLGKQYRIGELQTYRTLRESLQSWATAPFRRLANGQSKTVNGNGGAKHGDTIWALKDVSFSVKQGEVLGIIGHNGAGKSTLLKILSRITEPTTGEVRIHGRVNSLLEVGTGFHPELTGRENIFLNGSILGMSRAEIKRKFDEIVEFSGVEMFLDTPVKRYSSGMRVRLAFAVAAHLEPEILIIDEVLAVGDAEFQRKCLGKMEEVAGAGRTVLFVSHNMAAVENLCSQAFLLDKGTLSFSGEVADVTAEYLNPRHGDDRNSPGVYREARHSSLIREIRVLDEHGENTGRIGTGSELCFEIDLQSKERREALTARIVLVTDTGIRVCNCNSRIETNRLFSINGGGTVHCRLPDQRLAPGRYIVSVGIFIRGRQLEAVESALTFEVAPRDIFGTGQLPSLRKALYLPLAEWSTSKECDFISQDY
ncbi:ABC transporter ATP-binding protein [Symmachiella dynata]|uniref:ABC transporter ATP-binding protein n=1 Tax=Symmachiella dynata TaxID=2527995 RepID=UPI0030EE76F1